MRQTDSAVEYIKKHANDSKPFFMDVNFMKLHQPTSPNKMFAGKTHLGDYSDSVLELDYNVGRIMDAIRAEAPDTIVISVTPIIVAACSASTNPAAYIAKS